MAAESLVTRQNLTNLHTKVYDELKAMIYTRQLLPGERLVQRNLAKQMGTSSIPVIEALRRLQQDGLVIHVPHLGSFVKESTTDEVCEIYCLRRALESEAIRLFVAKATKEEKARLRELNDQLNEAARLSDIANYVSLDCQFHMHIVSGARVARLRKDVESQHLEEIAFAHSPELRTDEKIEHLIGVHDEILMAVEEGDAEKAASSMRTHLLKAEQSYLNLIAKRSKRVK